MKSILTSMALLGCTAAASAQTPVLNPHNGHYYEVIHSIVDWPAAKLDAESRAFLGVSGHLVTFSDQQEDDWVYDTLEGGPLGNAWIGLYQDLTASDYSEPAGGWRWVTGEPVNFFNWRSGEPNDGGGAEHYGGYWAGDQWNDYRISDGAVASYVVEYDVEDRFNYCAVNANSVGNGGLISAYGSASIALNDLTLHAGPIPDQPAMFLYGRNPIQVTFGNGNLCVTGGLTLLHPPIVASGNGVEQRLDLATLGIVPGTLNFQCWYRDPAGGGARYNTSDALSIPFYP